MNAPRSCNLILVRGDGDRKRAGSVVVRGGSIWWKSWCDATYLRRTSDALSLNMLVIDVLERWGVRDLFYVFGKGQDRIVYRTTIGALRRLGALTEHPGWGWNYSLARPLWTVDRSGFNLGYVPDGHDLTIPVPAECPRPVADVTERLTTRSEADAPAQLGLFDATPARVA